MGHYMVSNLEEMIKAKYRSKTKFAQACNLSRKTINRAVNEGERLIDDSIEKIALALGVDKSEIIDEKRTTIENEVNKLAKRRKDSDKPYDKLEMKHYINLDDVEKIVKVRYMGRSGPIDLEDGDKLNMYFFTTEIDKPLDECKVDISTTMKESRFLERVNNIYNRYKYELLHCCDDEIGRLDEKIISLRLGEEVTLRIIGEKCIDIIDFYPNGMIIHHNEIYDLNQSLLYKISCNSSLSLTDTIIPMGFEIIDKIIRCSLKASEKVSKYVEDNIEDFNKLRGFFIEMTSVLTDYFNKKISAKEAEDKINTVYIKITSYIYLLERLDELYGYEKLTRIYNMMLNRGKN